MDAYAETQLKPYEGDAPYVFVSYSHGDTAKVEGFLRLLFRNGIRFWYDKGITASGDWKEIINSHLERSRMFLCFLANGSEQRQEVMNEIQMAIEKHDRDEAYKVLFVFLEKMPSRVFGALGYDQVEGFINRVQHILYEGITEQFISRLFGEGVFSDELIREESLEQWRNRDSRDFSYEVTVAFQDNPYICETAFPEKDPDYNFYRVKMDQTDPDAVCLICLDNQWCPAEFYEDTEFWQKGFLSEHIATLQSEFQQREIFRALLHSRQLILNRASLYNSKVFEQWYDRDSADFDAFCRLLSNGSILVFLTQEDRPHSASQRPRFATNYYDIWGQICRENEIYCLRMDWSDSSANRMKVEQQLYNRFQDFCLTMGENRYLLEDLAAAFHFDELEKRDFIKIWNDIQLQVAARDRDEKGNYSRELFYKKYLVRRGTDVSDCILDAGKQFVPQLKEIVDFQYGLNLPEALGVRAIYPPGGHIGAFYQSAESLQSNLREISTDELTCAVVQFVPDFLRGGVSFPVKNVWSLGDIYALRDMPGWNTYIRGVTNGRKRARLQEVDFYDIACVWERYYQWLDEAREQTGETDSVTWREIEGSLSVIYHLGTYEILTVYHSGSNVVDIRTTLECPQELAGSQDHTVLLTIDYVCADVLKQSVADNAVLAELRLFEGITRDRLSVVCAALMKRLEAMPHRRIPYCPGKTERHSDSDRSEGWAGKINTLQSMEQSAYKDNRYYRNKRNSTAWLLYRELMEKRPELFAQNEMLSIETDLRTICDYERQSGVSVGVQYKSPYSMMVVDLVREKSGRCYTYERIVPTVSADAVVGIPVWEGKLVLLEQFRHALRDFQLAFPRGYGENGCSGEANVRKEIAEEIGAEVKELHFLGRIVADSGESGNPVAVYRCEISEPVLKKGYEGISNIKILTEEDTRTLVRDGKVNDGYTLGALSLLWS
ncbi:MAG: TIR domain-containing protein [Clostridiales bacterium]|nr:TIR domain-containing protein [Clostridiales bacterium]